MILCSNCQHQEIAGALFCSECGTQLVFTEQFSTHTISRPSDRLKVSAGTGPKNQPAPPSNANDALVSLFIVDGGQTLPLSGRNEFTLGRAAEGQPILPDVDFSPYSAYSQGVSRLHAVLKLEGSRVGVMDLGSSNGTRVNGQKIMPNSEFPLKHGDVVALGKFKLQILIRH